MCPSTSAPRAPPMTVADRRAAAPAAPAAPSVTAAQMADVDRLAVGPFGVELLQMMELAGSHLAEVARLELGGDLRGRLVVVAAGPGNNGGGGLAAARHLANRGAGVHVVLARPAARLSEAGRHQLATLLAMGVECCVMTYDLSDADLEALLGSADLVVDAVLGYSVQGAPRGEPGRLIELVAASGRPVLSLDLPSGTGPDTGEAEGERVDAAATLTLALPKAGLLTTAGRARAGRLYLGDLGLPAALYRELGIEYGAPFAGGPVVRVDEGA
jgi:NAD(P)H-hydrate epimerase